MSIKETVTMKDYEQDARDRIEAIDEQYHEQYAYMVMKSLRGSWRNPQVRIHILDTLCQRGEMFTEDVRSDIDSRIRSFKRNYFDGWHDGRTFRRVYENMDVELTADLARELADEIPDDMTWDEYRFEKMELE